MNLPAFLLKEQSMGKTGRDGPPIISENKVRHFLFLCAIVFLIYPGTPLSANAQRSAKNEP